VFNLVQALYETRSMADDHPDDERWQSLREKVDHVLGRLTDQAGVGEPISPDMPVGRLDRDGPHAASEEADRAAAALMAVHDRPEPEQLDLASAAVDDLADTLP
jgi:hypothetical protein